MRTGLRGFTLVFCAFLLRGATANAQQLSFTSRNYVMSPVAIVSTDASKEYGFESVMLRNDGAKAITGVSFQIVLRTDAADEVADERRFTVYLDPHATKQLPVGLAEIESLKQQTKSHHQRWALAILTIEAVEFSDGSEWKQSEREQSTPIDPLAPARPEFKQREK